MPGIRARIHRNTYTGKRITCEQAHASEEVLMPNLLSWDDEPPAAPVAIPGVTKFV